MSDPAMTPEQVDLIKRQICVPRDRSATDDELALFIGQCERTRLDPFSRQIYAVFRKQRGQEKMAVQVSIDGFRLIAERTGHYLGQDGPWWCGRDGVWSDIWVSEQAPIAARVLVRKAIGAAVAETPAVAHFSEYAVTKYDGSLTEMWVSKPALMLAKCAEALALRKAFPQELSGLYTAEEMAQADAPQVTLAPVPPPNMNPTTGEITAEPQRLPDDPSIPLNPEVAVGEERGEAIAQMMRDLGLNTAAARRWLGDAGVLNVPQDGRTKLTGFFHGLTPEQADALERRVEEHKNPTAISTNLNPDFVGVPWDEPTDEPAA